MTPLWVREGSNSVETQKGFLEVPVGYTITNPPAQHFAAGFSFCVRFKTAFAAGSDSQAHTTTTTSAGGPDAQPPHVSSPSSMDARNADNEENYSGDNASEEPSPVVLAPGVQARPSSGEEEKQKGDTHTNDPSTGVSPFLSPSAGSSTSSHGPLQDANHYLQELLPTAPVEEHTEEKLPSNTVNQEAASGLQEDSGVLARRLNGTPEVNEAYLPVVVHSGAWNSAAGMRAVSVVLLTVAATLLLVFQSRFSMHLNIWREHCSSAERLTMWLPIAQGRKYQSKIAEGLDG
ncbi:putative toxoplasma gondii family A protein [Toxoplasma gondii RUB]|uniref:Putative toxoplasma gondii family A protein n=1 Tax=Toxoplasma gondii RUB TaxID=935652 RepID=A0A086LPK7_TOXGO|nr:putative toxoplasma gondii family A protein [Toxoplasma gondii RUB]